MKEKKFEQLVTILGYEGLKSMAEGVWKLAWYIRCCKNMGENPVYLEKLHPQLKTKLLDFAERIEYYKKPEKLMDCIELLNELQGEVKSCNSRRKKSGIVDFISETLELLTK